MSSNDQIEIAPIDTFLPDVMPMTSTTDDKATVTKVSSPIYVSMPSPSHPTPSEQETPSTTAASTTDELIAQAIVVSDDGPSTSIANDSTNHGSVKPTSLLVIKLEVDKETSDAISKLITSPELVSCFLITRTNFHCTVLASHSYQNFDEKLLSSASDSQSKVRGCSIKTISNFDQEAIVCELDDPLGELRERNEYWLKSLSATNEHNPYRPHVTIGYRKAELTDSEKEKLFDALKDIKFNFTHETSRVINDNE